MILGQLEDSVANKATCSTLAIGKRYLSIVLSVNCKRRVCRTPPETRTADIACITSSRLSTCPFLFPVTSGDLAISSHVRRHRQSMFQTKTVQAHSNHPRYGLFSHPGKAMF